MRGISFLHILITASIFFKVQSRSTYHRNLWTRQRERLLNVKYEINGNMTTIYYNESYSRTFYNNPDQHNRTDDYHFEYSHENYEVDDEYNDLYDDIEKEEEEDSFGDDDNIFVSLETRADNLFTSSPTDWTGPQWSLFSALIGINCLQKKEMRYYHDIVFCTVTYCSNLYLPHHYVKQKMRHLTFVFIRSIILFMTSLRMLSISSGIVYIKIGQYIVSPF